MAEIILEDNIEIPSPRASYPFAKMKIDQSFTVAIEKKKAIYSATNAYARKHKGYKFVVREVEENKVRKVRCWRVASE